MTQSASQMPGYCPAFSGNRGKFELTVQKRKVCEPKTLEHQLFGEWSDFDAIKAATEEEGLLHAESVIAWLHNYHTYYRMTAWEIRLAVKRPKQGIEHVPYPPVP